MLVCDMTRVLLTSASSRWQPPHSCGTLMVATVDFMLEGGRMSCVPWQSLQPGANGSFCAAFLPWTLAAYWLCSWLWHRPQSTRANLSACGTSLMSLWQATHSRAAWGDAFKAAAWKPGGIPAWRLPVRGPASWQPAQSSERGCAACWARRPVANRVAVAASRSRFTAVIAWCFSTKKPIRDRITRYKDLFILSCVEICVKL